MLQSGFDSISLPFVFTWKKSIGFSNYKKYDGSECIIIWSHGFWLVVYAIMLMINFSFLIVLFGFMQYETYKLSWFLQRGAVPLFPTQNGLIFMPLTFELPLSPQLQEVDIVLHKATDEIISIEYELKSRTNFSNRIVYTRGMQDLRRWLFRSIKPYVSWFGLNLVIREKMNMPMLVIIYSLTWSSYHFFFFGGIVLWLCQHESYQALILAKVKCSPC